MVRKSSAAHRDLFDDIPVPIRAPDAVAVAERDRALDLLALARASLITEACKVALSIARSNGRVTSVEVVDAMKRLGFTASLAAHDRRWLGAVFRKGGGWRRLGYEPTGSHARPVAIWGRE
ncbi:MAG: hypothetical protein M3Q55_09235 [Acidobacteriota bacterium]|nr:hypothetical protein [Acidobacteriota bacterium]